jgi:hypothetical protein
LPKVSSINPVRPRTIGRLTSIQATNLDNALSHAKNGQHSKAAGLFVALASEMEASEPDVALDSASMRADAGLMMAQRLLNRNRDKAETLLVEAASFLEKALEPDPYWADYLLLRGRIRSFLHNEFGCRISRRNGTWKIDCIDVSNALHIPGISRSEKFDLECSICGKDPMFCAHIPGQTYDGRLALKLVKNLEFDHIAIMIDQIPEERNIGLVPRPLTDDDIREFFPEGKAREILSKGELRCKDLIRVIHQEHLGGMNFVRRSR